MEKDEDTMTVSEITIIDVCRELGLEPEKNAMWDIGAKVRKLYTDKFGELPPKDLRDKTNGPGQHMFAVYPLSMKREIIDVIADHNLRKARPQTGIRLSDRTMAILKAFKQINNSIVIEPGNKLQTMAPTMAVFASAEIDETFSHRLEIHDLGKFLGVLTTFSDETPDLVIKDERHVLVEFKSGVFRLMMAPQGSVEPPNKKIKHANPVHIYSLMANDLKNFLKGTNSIAAPHIVFEGADGRASIRATDLDNRFSANDFRILDGATDETFKVGFSADLFVLLTVDYKVSISAETKNAHLRGDRIEYFIAGKAK
jgi:hypothetical protein